MGTTRFNWEGLRDWVKTAEDKKCKKCQVPEHDTCGNSADCPCCRDSHRESTVRRSDLTKVGGLFRVRDDYETVWKMEAGEDGRSYITRLGEEGTEERVLVSEDNSSENYSKTAYRTVKEGLAHIVWECEECSTPNITKEGNKYECDGCHHQFPEVLSHNPKPEVYDRSAVAELYGDWAVDKMRREGINKINEDLLKIWAQEKHDHQLDPHYDPETDRKEDEDDDDWTPPWLHEKEDFAKGSSRKTAKKCDNCNQPIKNGKCQCSWGKPPKEGSRKEAGGADCPQCGDYVDPQYKEKHKKNCPGIKQASCRHSKEECYDCKREREYPRSSPEDEQKAPIKKVK